MSDLLEQLELPQCECLNQSKEHPLKHCISAEARDDPTLQLRSDCDEELLIHLKFMQASWHVAKDMRLRVRLCKPAALDVPA
eukprot:6188588-Pleurochrysis_carterae.AAC.8